MASRKSHKYQAIIRYLISVAILIGVIILSQRFYERFDLTTEKRYTLAESTKSLLRNLDDVIYVKVYLEGEFPAGFKRLRNSTKEMLEEFQAYSRQNIEFVFIDPTENTDAEQRNAVFKELADKGLQPTNLKVNENESYSQKIIFPGAILSYRGRELPVQLLENQIGLGPQQVLNNSVELLEYKLANSIRKLVQRETPLILFTDGHGELAQTELADIFQSLQDLQYQIGRIDLMQGMIPGRTDLLIVPRPTKPFDEKEKFKIDQFVMNGGSVLWLLDKVNANMDSLRGKDIYLAQAYDLNLSDQLFRYGVRVNTDVVQDWQCNVIPLVVGSLGDAPQTEMFPWFYFPVVTSNNEHAIVRNLDAIALKFASTIDTIASHDSLAKVKKHVLLHSSDYSKALLAPTRLHFSMLKTPPDRNTFNQSKLPLAVLMEGNFNSHYRNRVSPAFAASLDSIGQTFKERSTFAKMIVVGDGDIIRNEISNEGSAYPLGFYRFSERTYANRDFLLNCMEYLLDNNNLIETRNKEVRLRLLNRAKVEDEKSFWQAINVALPLIVIILFGLIFNFYRKKKYSK